MKKFTLLLAIIFIYTTTLSQSCLPAGITFATQEQIDNFQTDYPGCTVIEGNVLISSGSNELTNLNGLDVLTAIEGSLTIDINPFLGSFSGLDNLTSVGTDVYLRYNVGITDLTGLGNLNSIGGFLNVYIMESLTSLSGLDNLTSIGGYFRIYGCNVLTDLSGLDNLTTIGGNMIIKGNDILNSLTGLENLNNIGLYLWIENNDSLATLTGLDNLSSTGFGLFIEWSETLSDLTALSNLSTVGGGSFRVRYNPLLTDLTGLDNIDYESILHLYIYENPLLPLCEVESVCDYLTDPDPDPTRVIEIHDNAPGCNSAEEIEALCPACPVDITFTTQAQIDNFQTDYPGCTVIEGNVLISGGNITNLNGLIVLTAIGGDLWFEVNPLLSSLTGLDNLESVGGFVFLNNNLDLTDLTGLGNLVSIGGYLNVYMMNSLSSLSGLNNLTTIGGYLKFYGCHHLIDLSGLDNVTTVGGAMMIKENNMLTSLTGLESLNSISLNISIIDNDLLTSLTGLNNLSSAFGLYIESNETLSDLTALSNLSTWGGGSLRVRNNLLLTELTGLDNIDPESILNLYIYENPLLPLCEVESVCDYLNDPDPDPDRITEIHDNASGCNTEEEVIEACAVGISDHLSESFTIYPNPATNEIFISTNKGTIINEVNIYNQLGQKVLYQQHITNVIDVSMLQPGIYVIELILGDSKSDSYRIRMKLMIE